MPGGAEAHHAMRLVEVDHLDLAGLDGAPEDRADRRATLSTPT